ncbi:MAG: type II toxin-antitoxin system VapC family toxin [Thaumarchaeota archaeon]|nr:type II toxin-antitoxin system VapC family toxin [Nitrososphaerota archaeon]
MILLDTNIFLELLLGQKRAGDCQDLLERVSKGEVEAVATHFSIHATEALIGKGQLLSKFIRNIESSEGLYLYDTDLTEESSAALLTRQEQLDFDDALQYYVAKRLGADAIVSFDKHFDGLDVPRIEPGDVAH